VLKGAHELSGTEMRETIAVAARAPSCRRRFLRGSVAASVVLAAAKPSVAAWFPPTPAQPADPFYAPLRPLSIDKDLLYLPGSSIRADGDMLHIAGQVRDQAGPLSGLAGLAAAAAYPLRRLSARRADLDDAALFRRRAAERNRSSTAGPADRR
tara:strand:+ start:141 stop:602 length:462 start_codon:yes stop_codon:yes gene_type:complete